MLRTLIVDDEAPARQRLERLLAPLVDDGRVEVVGQAADGVEALAFVQSGDGEGVDLLLLDIRMPEMNGFDLIGQLAPEARPSVIFATAYDRYALQAFEENAVDYLLKPVKRERLEEAIGRVERRHARSQRPPGDERIEELLDWINTQQQEKDVPQADAPAEDQEHAQQISVSLRDRIRLVPTDQVVAIEIHEGITRLFVDETVGGLGEDDSLRQHVIDYTLDTLEDSLDPSKFMRVHRSAIVRLDRIDEMIPWRSGRYKLVLTAGHEVIASRDRSRQLRDRLMI